MKPIVNNLLTWYASKRTNPRKLYACIHDTCAFQKFGFRFLNTLVGKCVHVVSVTALNAAAIPINKNDSIFFIE